MPSEWTELEYIPFDDNVFLGSFFKWNDDHMDVFKELDSYYQYEIIRDKNVWDYYYCDDWECKGKFYTNLPEPDDDRSEEYDLPWCCYYLPHVPLGDEEFEIKCYDPNSLEVGEWYFVYAELSIKSEEKGSTLYVRTQSEYCGKFPLCGGKYGWCDMTRNTVTT